VNEPATPPQRAARCRQLLLGALLLLTVLAWFAKRQGLDALLAPAPFTGELRLGDPEAPVEVTQRTLLDPPAKLVVARVPRGGRYRLGVALNVPGAAALAGIGAPAGRRRALLATNGDYHRQGSSPCFASPFSTFVEGDAWHTLGSPFGYSCQFWLDAEGRPHVGRLDLRGSLQLPDGPLQVVLNGELGETLLWLRTPGAWTVPEGRLALPLKVLAPRVLRVAGPPRSAGSALQGPALLTQATGAAAPRLRALQAGQELTLEQQGADAGATRLVIGTGPRLLSDGVVPAALAEDAADAKWLLRAPRTAVGFDEDWVYLVTTLQDPRTGLSLPDFARALAALGCREAVNLDGGPSTSMWASGHAVINGPFEPEVGTALLVLPPDEAGVELR